MTASASATATASLWPQPIEVLGLTGEFASGKTLFGLTISPGPSTLVYDMEKSSATYQSLGFERIDVPTEMLRAYPGGYKPIDTFNWWLAHVKAIPAGKYRVIMLDPVSEVETGLADWVKANPSKFGRTAAQYVKMSGLMWGDVKEYWKSILADLASRCETFAFTSHMTNIWRDDKPTGKRKAKGKETLMELATLYLNMERKANGKGELPAKPAAVALKSRLSTIKFDPGTGDTTIVPTLPPRLPIATPFAIRQYMAAPPDYSKLSPEECAPEATLTDDERAELAYATAAANRDTEEMRLNRESRESERAAARNGARPGEQVGASQAKPRTEAVASPTAGFTQHSSNVNGNVWHNAVHAEGGATDEQIARLASLKARWFAANEVADGTEQRELWATLLQKRGVTTAYDLSVDAANDLINKLADQVNENNKLDSVFQGKPADETPAPNTTEPVATASLTN